MLYCSVVGYLTFDQCCHRDWLPVEIEVSLLPTGDLFICMYVRVSVGEYFCERARARETENGIRERERRRRRIRESKGERRGERERERGREREKE